MDSIQVAIARLEQAFRDDREIVHKMLERHDRLLLGETDQATGGLVGRVTSLEDFRSRSNWVVRTTCGSLIGLLITELARLVLAR